MRKRTHFWWVAGALIILVIFFNKTDWRFTDMIAVLSVCLNVVLLYWIGDYFHENQTYSTALWRIRDNEAELAKQSEQKGKEPPYRKPDNKIFRIADDVLRHRGELDVED